ncbi:YjcZ family sporulation protein [Sporosarcina cascadiensis]|nr:YjcZ family sporulation protein [Sporosarcina cascadiensis]
MFGFGGYGHGGGAGCERPCSGTGNVFALIVVLFILLIIVGAACL